ncbi:MAG: hypothetical protein V4724_35935 [Pseudomonadota bacterium]
MYTLIDFIPDDADAQQISIVQGRASAIACARRAECSAFIDHLLLPADAAMEAEFHAGRHRVRRHLPVRAIGLVSRKPTVLAHLSVRENIGLVEPRGAARRHFWQAVDAALDETGLLADIDPETEVASLEWHTQVEINFLQMWLRQPECLLFDRVFEHDDGDALLHLPSLFRARFPLRAVCYLQQRGALPAALGVTDTVHL